MIPTQRKIYAYVLSAEDAEQINRRRVDAYHSKIGKNRTGAQVHVGSSVHAEDVFPVIITIIHDAFEDDTTISGQVFLNGNDTLWVSNVRECVVNAGFPTPEAGKWYDYEAFE